ncbi:FkbM family methyltransferase [Roseateles oligotrophus]|uniref:FkbM family methyltransferase n=1 Tax=Roseateles oligotrophus TaxID=1769250 RepID=A0ABT2YMB8_9BURK|nr:FkbM family methyltransferase [Roseateles oligotrophus]MCV2371196.1 FkbM family methyltransferase [Roseateles oligotrophus]
MKHWFSIKGFYMARHLPSVEIFPAQNGVKYMLFCATDANGISGCIRKNGTYEPNLQMIAEVILQSRAPGGRVIDVGANMGSFTVPLAQRFRDHTFECFEVQRPIYYQLCGNIVLNGLGNVVAHQIGMGSASGEISVNLPDYDNEFNVGAFTLNNELHKDLRGETFKGEAVKIKLLNLDSMYFDDVRLIKIDVEGMELDVLRGAVGTLVRNNYPSIIYEAWDFDWYAEQKVELEKFLVGLGYIIGNFDGSLNFVAQHPKAGPMIVHPS